MEMRKTFRRLAGKMTEEKRKVCDKCGSASLIYPDKHYLKCENCGKLYPRKHKLTMRK
jgi:ribosomal protein S27AE